MYILGGCRTVAKSLLILIKSTLFNWVLYFSFASIFFPSIFPHDNVSVSVGAVWVMQRHAVAFLNSVKQKSNFSETFEWQEILRRKPANLTITLLYKTTQGIIQKKCKLDFGNSSAESNNWSLAWAFGNKFLCSDFLLLSFKVCENYLHPHASYSHYCVCLHKFPRVNQIVLVSYMSHKLRTKTMAQLNFVQQLQIANQKGYSNFDNRHAHHDFYQKNIWCFCACVVQMSRK